MAHLRNIHQLRLPLLLLLLFAGCGYDRFPDDDPVPPQEPNATMTIARLRSFYTGLPTEVNSLAAVVSGHVTSSDQTGNFFRSFFIEDATGALEIREGGYDLHNHYRLGQRVTVLVNGLVMGMENGTLQVGRRNLLSNGQQTDYLDHKPTAQAHLLRGADYDTLPPARLQIGQLSERWIGCLVRIDDLELLPAVDTTWALPAALAPGGIATAGNLLCFVTPRDSIYINTSGYATFAAARVPRGRFSVTGILAKMKNKEVYQLKMRDLNDVESR